MQIQPSRFRVLLADGDRIALFTQSLREPKVDLALLGVARLTEYCDAAGPGIMVHADGNPNHWFISWINLHTLATNWAVLRWDGDILLVSPITIFPNYVEPLTRIGQICGLPENIRGVYRRGVR